MKSSTVLLLALAGLVVWAWEKKVASETSRSEDFLSGPSNPPDWWKNDPFFSDPESFRKEFESRRLNQ